MTIEQLRLQLYSQERELQATGQMINDLTQLLEEEQAYTRQLTEKTQTKPQPEATPPKPTKAEQVAKLSDNQLLSIMGNPKKRAELFKGL
jgi:hypothetical protein